MAHHIALVEISPRPWTAGICFAASQVERRPILFTGSHLCVPKNLVVLMGLWSPHGNTKTASTTSTKSIWKKTKKNLLWICSCFFQKNIYHFLFHFTFKKNVSVELRVFFWEALATPWAKAPQVARTAKLGISLETTWCCLEPTSRGRGRVGGVVGRRILGGIFPMGWFIRTG